MRVQELALKIILKAEGLREPMLCFRAARRTVCNLTNLVLALTRLVRCALIGMMLSPPQMLGQSSVADVPAANPGRPTVSTPATLTPVGYLQFETGGLYAQISPEFTTRFA
jgi:hypothetical protein